MRKFRVIVLMHDYMVPPEDVSGHDLMTVPWKTEHDVIVTLQEMGHDVLYYENVEGGHGLGSTPAQNAYAAAMIYTFFATQLR